MNKVVVFCVMLLIGSGCSLLIDLSECETAADCDGGLRCESNICVGGETGTNNGTNNSNLVSVSENIGVDATWKADKVYILENIITVGASATLTIEPGTLIKAKPNSALVVRPGGRLNAEGTRKLPIVFTSFQNPGRRQPGDWGGIAILGKAPVNRDNFALRVFDEETLRPVFGGDISSWNCGIIQYVRIEFGGGPVEGAEALNGLIVGGCGTETVVNHLQIHASADDGFEIFGGTFDFRHVVLTRNGDDSIDIDTGWTGTGQFLAVQQDASGETGMEVDNLSEDPTKTPLTDFRIYNYTLIGTGAQGASRGFTFKAGAGGFLSHGIIMGMSQGGLDVIGSAAGARALDDQIVVENSLWFDIGAQGSSYFPKSSDPSESDPETGDNGFDENTYFRQEALGNRFGDDPKIPNVNNLEAPGWVPASAPAVTGVAPPPTGFDPTAVYLGAFVPGADPWTEDWTAYPPN